MVGGEAAEGFGVLSVWVSGGTRRVGKRESGCVPWLRGLFRVVVVGEVIRTRTRNYCVMVGCVRV